MNRKLVAVLFILMALGCSIAQAQTVPALMQQGKSLLEQNKTDSAVLCFEKVLTLDSKNYDALAYLCNYQFLLGQKALDKIETMYLAIETPTRMQVAQYNEDLLSLYDLYFSKAEKFLIQAYLIRRNDHLDDLAGQIADFKERIGMLTPGTKKSWLKRILPL
jgi:tetratricopeptide (TPR) repeat protein